MPDSGSPEAMPLAMITMSGRRIGPLGGEEAAGARVAGLHLVDGEQDPVAVGDLAQGGQEAVRRDDVSALPEHRLDHERGHVVRRDHGREEARRSRRCVVASAASAPPMRSGYGYGAKWTPPIERLEVGAVLHVRAGEGHGAVGAAVEPAAERDDVRATRATFASFTAASTASAPEFDRKRP